MFKMIYTREVLDDLINVQCTSYRDIGKMYGVSDTAIKKAAKKLGIILPIRSKFADGFIPHNKKLKYCANCGTITKNPQFCNKNCEGEYKSNQLYSYYLRHQEEYCDSSKNIRFVKRHILIEQKHKCSICAQNNTWNNKELILILDHIDGNASNNRRNNLRLICSNCDSQLETYKSKNKNSARKERYLLNYKHD